MVQKISKKEGREMVEHRGGTEERQEKILEMCNGEILQGIRGEEKSQAERLSAMQQTVMIPSSRYNITNFI
jgi:hypothetical protein